MKTSRKIRLTVLLAALCAAGTAVFCLAGNAGTGHAGVSGETSAEEKAGVKTEAEEQSSRMRFDGFDLSLFNAGIANPSEYASAEGLEAGIVPHHLVASDMIAGFFKMSSESGTYDTVLILSTSHFEKNCSGDITTADADWDTAAGSAVTDHELTEKFISDPAVRAENNMAAIAKDHGVSGLVPFVRHYMPKVKVCTCIIANSVSRKKLDAVLSLISAEKMKKRLLVVASVDFSHYLMPDEAAVCDRESEQAIGRKDYDRLLTFHSDHADSPPVLYLFLKLSEKSGQVSLLDHSSSFEKLSHIPESELKKSGITTYFVYRAVSGR